MWQQVIAISSLFRIRLDRIVVSDTDHCSQQYVPRNRVPWSVILVCTIVCPLLLLWLRWRLARENRRRDLEDDSLETIQDTYIIQERADGTKVEIHIDQVMGHFDRHILCCPPRP